MKKKLITESVGAAKLLMWLAIAFGLSICFAAGQHAWDAVSGWFSAS
ncbi:hypothetical protein [Roseateles sp.]|jgi:hypothetical protein